MQDYKLLSWVIVFVVGFFAFKVNAAERKNVFDNPENLQVLPKDIGPRELSQTMKGFAMGLGLRCENCHEGEAGKPLTTFDFSSDEKPLKRKARIMLKMVNSINTEMVPTLNSIEKGSQVQVRCVTCHRGQQKPLLIQDALQLAADTNKPGAVSQKYKELRDKFYGSHTYDFSEFVLPMFAQELHAQKRGKEGLDILKTNVELLPDSFYGLFSLGMAFEQGGDIEKALVTYKKALKVNPNESRLKQKIKSLSQASQ